MSLTEILAEIPKLSFAERRELVRRAIEVEDDELRRRKSDSRRAPRRFSCQSGFGDSHGAAKNHGSAAAQAAMIRQIIARPSAVEDVVDAEGG